jgi:hypothetical protein
MTLKEYRPGTAFSGSIGRTFDQSEPAWPEPLRSKEDAPNSILTAGSLASRSFRTPPRLAWV